MPPTHSRATATPLLLPAPQQRCWSQSPPQSGVFFKKITILKYYLFALGEGYTLTTGTPTSIDVWIAAARHSFCLFLHFFKYKNAVNNDKLSSSSKLSNFKDNLSNIKTNLSIITVCFQVGLLRLRSLFFCLIPKIRSIK